MAVTWLHVSDFHIREGDPYDRQVVLRALVESVRRMREKDNRKPDLIFATGDIAFSGKPAEYELATRFFDELLDAANVDREHLFVIPGNHDVDRTLSIGLARTLETREEADAYFGPKVPKVHITQKLGAFVAWHDSYFAGIRSTPTDTTCGPVMEVPVDGIRIGLLPINSALFCQGDDDHGRLLIGRRALEPALDQLQALKADINIALVHHPLDWLSDVDESNIRASLQANVDVLLRGHLHKSDVESTVPASGGYLHVAAGAAYQTRKWPNRALYGTFDGTAVTIFPIRYEDQPREVWVVDPSVFPDDAAAGYGRTFSIPRLSASLVVPTAPAPPQPSVAPAPSATLQFRSNIQPRHHLPFVGRDGLLDKMRTVFADTSVEAALVLHGQPGVGKSELAREYGRMHRQRYPGGTFLIRAGSGGESVDLAHIGKVQLGLEFPSDLSIQEQAERTVLSLGSSPVLLVYDNVTSEVGITPWLPPAGIPCHVMVTTNLEHWSPRWRRLEVERLPDTESLGLVEQVGGKQVAARFGEELVRIAGGLPVVLVPAATALAYEERRGRLDTAQMDIVQQARNSFRVPYESLSDPERLLLHSAAFLNIQRIIRSELFNALAAGAGWSEDEFRARLDACLDLHVLEGSDELRMHQLFASFVQDAALPVEVAEELRLVRDAQRKRMLEVARELDDNPANSDWAARLNGFRLGPQEWVGGGEISADDGRTIGRALYKIGKFEEARPWFERAVAVAEQGDIDCQVDHEKLGSDLHTIGYCFSRVGKYNEARSWFERAVEEKQQGDIHGRVDHDSLSRSMHQVGWGFADIGRYQEALLWFERAVKEAQQGDVLGRVHHTSLGSSLHQVGFCLSRIGNHDEARPWYERAVEEKQHGDAHGWVDHESLGRSLHQVGYCLSGVEKYEEAQPWYERAVEEKQQGDVHGRVDHQELGKSLHQVGYGLSIVGKYEEARPWYEHAVEEAELGDVYGRVDHEILGWSLHQVGDCLSNVGKHEEALSWYERAVEESRKGDIFGRIDNASLRITLTAVANCLRKLGRPDEAQEWEDEFAKLEAEQAASGDEAG